MPGELPGRCGEAGAGAHQAHPMHAGAGPTPVPTGSSGPTASAPLLMPVVHGYEVEEHNIMLILVHSIQYVGLQFIKQ